MQILAVTIPGMIDYDGKLERRSTIPQLIGRDYCHRAFGLSGPVMTLLRYMVCTNGKFRMIDDGTANCLSTEDSCTHSLFLMRGLDSERNQKTKAF